MTEKKQSRIINVELQRADPKLKIALIVLILCSLVALAALRWVHVGLQAENQKLRSTAASVEYANSQLEEINAEPDSVQSVRSIAKQELGLVDPATVVIDPIS